MDVQANSDAPTEVNQHLSGAVDTGIELANTVVAIVKEVGEMLNNVPYVKSLSGVILQVIKIRDEIKANKERCRQIIDKTLRMSISIYEKLDEIARSSQRERLGKLENYLNRYENALKAVCAELEKHRSGRSLVAKLTNRGLDELNAHDRYLDELNSQLMLDIIFHNTIEQAASVSTPNQLTSSNELDVSKQMQDLMLVGQVNAAEKLVWAHINRGDLVEAEKLATASLATATNANYTPGEGNAHRCLGYIYLKIDKVPEASQALELALRIAKQGTNVVNRLNCVHDLGRAYIRLDELSKAEVLLTESARLELDLVQIPIIMTNLAWVYICGDRPDKAEPLLRDALQRFRKFGNKSRQTGVLAHLGNIYLKSDRLDEAELTLTKSILDLGIWRDVEMRRGWVLGELYIIRGRLEDAEASLSSAMRYAKSHQCSWQQGNILRSMGALHVKRGHIDLAIEKFKEAREVHRKAQWISEQVADLKELGKAYKMLERSEEADTAFEEVEKLTESVREARTLKA